MNNFKPIGRKATQIRVLLTDTNRWALSARLAMSLAEAGCHVEAICPSPRHALMKTRAVQRIYKYSGFRPLESLNSSIEASEPDIIIPACDRSVAHLHQLHARAKFGGVAENKLTALIEHSLGSPASYAQVTSRYDLLLLAHEEGIRVPRMSPVKTSKDLDSWRTLGSCPSVLKADGTWGGRGVRIIRSPEEADHSFGDLARMSRFSRAVKRLVVNRDSFSLRSWLKDPKPEVIIQSYIYGRPANCAVVCWEGRVLAAIAVEVVRSAGLTGPASVVHVVENPEMLFAAERIASRLGLSGFFGLDFMIEEGTNAAYLIEMNPRSTPPCHLRLDKGRNLADALWAQLAGQPRPEDSPVTHSNVIAYFPQAFAGQEKVPEEAFLDIPHSEPELIQELLNPFPDNTFMFRLIQRLKGNQTETHTSDLLKNRAGDPLHTVGAVQGDSLAAVVDTTIEETVRKAKISST